MNRATKLNIGVLGVIFGISGMNHGFFEILQGNTPTPNLFIFAIGEAQKMWVHGNEPALTLLPNFLLSGIVAMLIGLAIVVWSLGFVHRKHGSLILFSLFILLLLLGGGVAQILFFPWICLVASRITKPLAWWKKVLPTKSLAPLANLWKLSLIVSATLLVVALVIATTGFVPMVTDPEVVLSIMLVCLGLEVIAFPLTFVSGFAYDLKAKEAN
jgi:hypothetical protein